MRDETRFEATMTRIVATLVSLSLLGLANCARAVPVKASYCSTIAAFHTSDRSKEMQLTRILEGFTRKNGFVLAGGQQVDTNEYQNSSEKVLIELTYGMGDFGSIITMYYKGHDGDSLRNKLDSYMNDHVDPVFKTKKCSAIPGFETPVLTDVVH